MNANLAVYLTQFALALVLAPLLPGIINRVKAKYAGRHGKPVLQTYYDIAKLLRKGEVISRTSTWTFAAAPSIALAGTLCALALLPLGGAASPLAFAGDFVLAAYLLGMGRFAVMLGALDTGSAFEGMGASREATFSALAEPVFFLALMVLTSLCLGLGHSADTAFSLSTLFGGQTAGAWLTGRGELLLLPVIFFMLLLVENCRIPVDDPNTHLELTMIHEVMVLDHSGPNLAMILYGAALKLWFFAALIAGLLTPSLPLWQQMGLRVGIVLLLAVVVGIVESVMARLRMERVPYLLGAAGAMGTLALILTQAR
ncbi:respiratory chain complex I subunit 1 family protein [Desulfovibrio desulfuricans]|uniref:respiratory chain complex I subunit 1 family protein n=1 Tax=Desulfovibrio desulfuricans TaxID=876 RepID=UPI0035B38BFD